ncbi:MAG: RNA ligase family protein [Candidatus Saccharimonadales bacterium]
MGFGKPKNPNYCCTVTRITSEVKPLEGCDNVMGVNIFGNHVIVGKDTKVGDIGVYVPVETQLMPNFLYQNSLYRHSERNLDKTKKGYFEDTGRVKCMKFRKHPSMGVFFPLAYFNYCRKDITLEPGDAFDTLNGEHICQKYHVVRQRHVGNTQGNNKRKRKPIVSKIIDGQFYFHIDTEQLGKNIFKIKEQDLLHISYKLHGTSFVSAKVLCKKPLGFFSRIFKKLGFNIIDSQYDYLYSSRNVLRNHDLNKQHTSQQPDVYEIAHNKVKDTLVDGMTYYGEIVGFRPSGAYIQKAKGGSGYDYGCTPGTCNVYIYRITYTNPTGCVFEFSAQQVREWCHKHNLKPVPTLDYNFGHQLVNHTKNNEEFQSALLTYLRDMYLERKCHMCKNDVPAEGIVVRVEKLNLETYKLKSFEFLKLETEQLDKGISTDEEENEEDQITGPVEETSIAKTN